MENNVLIRAAGPADIPVIEDLARQVWPVTYGHILSADQLEYMLQLIYSDAALTAQMEKQHHFLMAILAGQAVGFASWSATSEPFVFKLQKIYVRTDIQGKGIGQALIAAVIKNILPLNAAKLWLNVNRYNKAKSFYEKHGFTVIAEENINIGNGYFMNDYVMEKKL